MKNRLLFISFILIILNSCKQDNGGLPESDLYRNVYTGEFLTKPAFDTLIMNLHNTYSDSTKGQMHMRINFLTREEINDTVIQPFSYDIRIGNEYVVKANSYEKVGMEIASKTFESVDGSNIQIGGVQEKPMMINLWFIECPGCIAEIPALNRLQERYADRVNFVAMTFENKEDTEKFLKRKEFNFIHIADASDYIDYIGSKPYPENIFIGRDGKIKYIEGGLPHSDKKEDMDKIIEHFEYMLNTLLAQEN